MIEVIGYIFHFGGIICGPTFFFKDYQEFISGDNYECNDNVIMSVSVPKWSGQVKWYINHIEKNKLYVFFYIYDGLQNALAFFLLEGQLYRQRLVFNYFKNNTKGT